MLGKETFEVSYKDVLVKWFDGETRRRKYFIMIGSTTIHNMIHVSPCSSNTDAVARITNISETETLDTPIESDAQCKCS